MHNAKTDTISPQSNSTPRATFPSPEQHCLPRATFPRATPQHYLPRATPSPEQLRFSPPSNSFPRATPSPEQLLPQSNSPPQSKVSHAFPSIQAF